MGGGKKFLEEIKFASYQIKQNKNTWIHDSGTVSPTRLNHIAKQHCQLKTKYSFNIDPLGNKYYSNHNKTFQILCSIWRLYVAATTHIWKRNDRLWMQPAQGGESNELSLQDYMLGAPKK